jgi:hypothetical protein
VILHRLAAGIGALGHLEITVGPMVDEGLGGGGELLCGIVGLILAFELVRDDPGEVAIAVGLGDGRPGDQALRSDRPPAQGSSSRSAGPCTASAPISARRQARSRHGAIYGVEGEAVLRPRQRHARPPDPARGRRHEPAPRSALRPGCRSAHRRTARRCADAQPLALAHRHDGAGSPGMRHHASTPLTTSPATSVRRKSRPWVR